MVSFFDLLEYVFVTIVKDIQEFHWSITTKAYWSDT